MIDISRISCSVIQPQTVLNGLRNQSQILFIKFKFAKIQKVDRCRNSCVTRPSVLLISGTVYVKVERANLRRTDTHLINAVDHFIRTGEIRARHRITGFDHVDVLQDNVRGVSVNINGNITEASESARNIGLLTFLADIAHGCRFRHMLDAAVGDHLKAVHFNDGTLGGVDLECKFSDLLFSEIQNEIDHSLLRSDTNAGIFRANGIQTVDAHRTVGALNSFITQNTVFRKAVFGDLMLSRQNIEKCGIRHDVFRGNQGLLDLLRNRLERSKRKNALHLFFHNSIDLRLVPRITRGRCGNQIGGKRRTVAQGRDERKLSFRPEFKLCRPSKGDHTKMRTLGKTEGLIQRHGLSVHGNGAKIFADNHGHVSILFCDELCHCTGHTLIGGTELHGISHRRFCKHKCGNGLRKMNVRRLRLDLTLMERIVRLVQKLVADDLRRQPIAIVKIKLCEAFRQLCGVHDLFAATADIVIDGSRQSFFFFIYPSVITQADRFFVRPDLKRKSPTVGFTHLNVHDGDHVFAFL